ncbi:MAG: GNAT family N-acetyltransferase [Magnetovibrio sp.]|nr:GNAT family N-acetyltransferase [Magnetovibrio sp.]
MTGDPEFRGTAAQLALQRGVLDWTERATTTPGLFQGGRLVGIDDLPALGDAWVTRIYDALGAVIVKFLPAADEADFRARFAADGRRYTGWDVFIGGRDALAVSEARLGAAALPAGWCLGALDPDASPETIAAIQGLQEISGVAPVPGYYQRGQAVPAVVALLTDAADGIVATAQAYARHHAESPWAGYVFAGMVAVHPDHRRRGFGALINAQAISLAFQRLPCTHVYEHAAADNRPSRGMIEACGLRQNPGERCIMFHDAARYGVHFTK